jgi:hypothetical protein
LEIGGGTALTGNFSTIDWADGPYFIKTEIDPNGGTSYTIQGTTQLLSVPYAFYAKTSGPVNENDPIFRASPAFGIKNSDITNWNNKDDSNTNELQTLSINGNRLTISDGNTVALPTGSGGDQWGSQVVASDETLNGDGTEGNLLAVNESASLFDDWDKDVNDDFSGDYNDLTNKPVTFYEIGTTNPPNAINDDMYHTGNISIGTNAIISGNKVCIKGINTQALLSDIDYTGSNYGNVVENKLTMNANTTNIEASCAAIFNKIDGTGSIFSSGVVNLISNSGNETHIGTYDILTGRGNGEQYGYNTIISNSGSGSHYGIADYLTGRGSGAKFGVFSKIATSAGGNHYAIYGEVTSREITKSGDYAGYFKGDVYVSRKLKANHSGSADMKSYIYGRITSAGNIEPNASSDGFTCERTDTGRYKITFSTSPGAANNYIVIATSYGSVTPSVVNITQSVNYFSINIHNLSGTYSNWYFNFVVYKK